MEQDKPLYFCPVVSIFFILLSTFSLSNLSGHAVALVGI